MAYEGSNEPKLVPPSSNGRSTPLIPKFFEQLPRNVLKRGRRGIQNSFSTGKIMSWHLNLYVHTSVLYISHMYSCGMLNKKLVIAFSMFCCSYSLFPTHG